MPAMTKLPTLASLSARSRVSPQAARSCFVDVVVGYGAEPVEHLYQVEGGLVVDGEFVEPGG
jgi:hypothetical protein